MDYRIFPDLDQFVTAWYGAQTNLTQIQKDILHASLHDRQTLAEIAQRYGITREYVRQIAEKAAERLLREARKARRDPVHTAIAKAAKIADMAGLEIALRPRSLSAKQSEAVIQQFTTIGAISPDQTPWTLVILDTMTKPKQPRPSLRRLVHDARQVAGYHHRGITPRHLRDHLTQWHDTIAQWPRFDIALHIKAMTGTATDPNTGTFHPVIGWTTFLKADPQFVTHYMVRALDDAQRCLNIDEITTMANQIAHSDGIDHRYSKAQITAKIQRRPGIKTPFKWVGRRTFGLSSWDVGHSNPNNQRGIRLSISDEIFNILETSSQPMPIDEIRDHIRKRFEVTDGALDYALSREVEKGTMVVNPNRTVSLTKPA